MNILTMDLIDIYGILNPKLHYIHSFQVQPKHSLMYWTIKEVSINFKDEIRVCPLIKKSRKPPSYGN